MRRPALALLGACLGCGEASLSVVFEVPRRFADEVRSSQVRLLRPPSGATFDCAALAWGELSDDAVRLSLERQVGVAEGERAPLSDVDRTARKIVLAEALGADGAVLARGCAEVDEILGQAEVRIAGEPVPRLALATSATVGLDLGEGRAVRIEARVRDRFDVPLDGIEVEWRRADPTGRLARGMASSERGGRARLDAEAPRVPGPFRVEVRARWMDQAPLLVSGFVRPPPESGVLGGRARDYRTGRVGPNGEPGVAALLASGPGQSRVARVYRDGSGALVESMSAVIGGADATLGLIERPGEGSDRPVVITTDGWWEIQPSGEALERPAYRPPASEGPRRAVGFNPCDGSAPELLVVYGEGRAIVHRADGTRGPGFRDTLDVVAAGCVENELGAPVRLMVAAQPSLQFRLVAEARADLYWIRGWLALPDGVSIGPGVGDQPSVLIGSQLDLDDIVVSRAAVRVDGERFELAPRATNRPPAYPLATRGGDFDGDGELDTMSIVERLARDPRTPPTLALWAVYGEGDASPRLAGAADLVGGPGPTGFVDPDLLVVDLDRDGRDDVVIGERMPEDNRPSQIVVYSMGLLSP
jgi:hypothetical protein